MDDENEPDEDFQEFPDDSDCFDHEAFDEMARDDLLGISYEQARYGVYDVQY